MGYNQVNKEDYDVLKAFWKLMQELNTKVTILTKQKSPDHTPTAAALIVHGEEEVAKLLQLVIHNFPPTKVAAEEGFTTESEEMVTIMTAGSAIDDTDKWEIN